MNKLYNLLKLFIIIVISSCYPAPKMAGQFTDEEFNEMANKMANGGTPDITIKDLKKDIDNIILLDAREKKEYEVSHIKNATWIGYDDFNIERLPQGLDENAKIVVYCSVGYRSERIGEKILSKGYKNVYNLKGSIFQWINEGNPIVNQENQVTTKIHGYNEKWSKWIKQGEVAY